MADRQKNYLHDVIHGRKNTTVTRDGKTAVSSGGGKTSRWKMRSGKASKWVADHQMNKHSRAQAG